MPLVDSLASLDFGKLKRHGVACSNVLSACREEFISAELKMMDGFWNRIQWVGFFLHIN